MIKLEFSIHINASCHTLWHALWHDPYYRYWTRAFSEGSYAESDWKEGSEIKFLDSKGNGIYSMIERMSEPVWMVFRHKGEIIKGIKQPESKWANATEAYRLKASENGTNLVVEMETTDDFTGYFQKTFPKALGLLKSLAESEQLKKIGIEVLVNQPKQKVWELWTQPVHITKWNFASGDWHTPSAVNDLKVNGRFSFRMESKDAKTGFDFSGTCHRIDPAHFIDYSLDDGRRVTVSFTDKGNQTLITETFEPEAGFSLELQRKGWQAILNNFKNYAEGI